MIKKKYIIFFVFFIIAAILNYVFFYKIDGSHFLFMGDQFFRFNYFEAFINSFFIQKPENLSVLNGWQFTTQYWDALYYLLAYSLHLPFIIAEKILFFLLLFLSLSLSYVGLKKLNNLLTLQVNTLSLLIITVWYCINPYTVILWHGGVYNLGSSLTYSLAPLIIYYSHLALLKNTNLKNIIIASFLLLIASFTFWLFAPLLLFLILYILGYLTLNRISLKIFIKNSVILLLIYLPLAFPILFGILYEYLNGGGNNNSTFVPTFTNQMGGIRFQLYMWFSWGIYNVWNPRSLFSYGEYYFSQWYLLPTKILYLLIIFGGLLKVIHQWQIVLKSKQKKLEAFLTLEIKMGIIFLFIFLLSAFFAKGAQPPFGQLFLYLYNNMPLFSVFRTPDIRFGFPIILSLSLLLLLIAKQYKIYILVIVLVAIIFFQNYPFFTGVAIKGESIKNRYYDRVLYVPNDYIQVASFLNGDNGSGYILPIPAISYGHYLLDGNKNHIGQDMLSKLIRRPFLYLSLSDGTYQKTYRSLYTALQKKNIDHLRQFPIKYVIFRRDVVCDKCGMIQSSDLDVSYKEVLRNKTFSVYRDENYTPVVSGENITFTQINPIKYRISMRGMQASQYIAFLLSFNKDWEIFLTKAQRTTCKKNIAFPNAKTNECFQELKYLEGDEPSYFWSKPLFEKTHKLYNGYANVWKISPDYIKNNFSRNYYSVSKDGTIDFELVLFYKPQLWFYLTLLLSSVFSLIMATYLILSGMKSKR